MEQRWLFIHSTDNTDVIINLAAIASIGEIKKTHRWRISLAGGHWVEVEDSTARNIIRKIEGLE